MFSYLNTRNQVFSPKNITVPLVTKKFSFASERREGGVGGRRVDSISLYNNSDQIQPPHAIMWAHKIILLK
jgi:hypothetical protein